jgi:hypothetical protein
VDPKRLEKLQKKGAVVRSGTGEVGVLVSFQYRPALASGSRDDRRRELMEHFSGELAPVVDRLGGALDPATLSVSGQTLLGLVPPDHLDDVKKALEPEQFRMDVVVDQQVVDAPS